MDDLIKRLATQTTAPRLWFERLAIFSEPGADHCIRSITFRRGINIVWAREPDDNSTYAGVHAAGHGVGKTSLCLLLRYCLGDSGKAIDELRDEVLDEYPQGGVGAVVHVGSEVFAVFRFFNPHREGFASPGDDLDALLTDGGTQSFKDFEAHLSAAMLSGVSPRTIPETGQAILWRHVLAWMARDQGGRFKSFFSWREGEGTGLQRPRQDPPIVMRAVLGLLDQDESQLLMRLRSLELELEAAEEATAGLRQEPSLIRGRIESELRAWLRVPADLPMRSDDLFKDSVETAIRGAKTATEAKLARLDGEDEALTNELFDLRVEHKQRKADYDLAEDDYQMADAARRNDESAYRQIAERREKLKNLPGPCEYGRVAFQECTYILKEIQTLSYADGRDLNALTKVGADWTARAAQALERRTSADKPLQLAKQRVDAKAREAKALRIKRDTAALELDRGQRLLAELERWELASGSPEAAMQIEQSVSRCTEIANNIDAARVRLVTLQHERSSREQSLSGLTDLFARALLSNEAFGTLEVRDETRPFRLSLRGGEAFRVLEILLGDVVCLLDASDPASAFPGLMIHDCPREADMGPRPYRDFLHLVERIEREAYGDSAPFQYIVTTTTPPPDSLQQPPFLSLTLDPSHDEGLLFGRRFSAFTQTERLSAHEETP
ncbi:MAG: hypothetical protein Q8L93_11840 [Rhodocyclaceae bacterium]|nr:hypothetical protein [Rhodocyclaceae bacterium]